MFQRSPGLQSTGPFIRNVLLADEAEGPEQGAQSVEGSPPTDL